MPIPYLEVLTFCCYREFPTTEKLEKCGHKLVTQRIGMSLTEKGKSSHLSYEELATLYSRWL